MKVKIDTIIRTIVLAIALINQVLTSMGKNPLPFSEDTAYEFFTLAFTLGTSIWSWWKNNSYTDAAIMADGMMVALKTGLIKETHITEDDEAVG